MLVKMVESWNTFNLSKSVKVNFEESEFSPKNWSLELSISGVVCSEFVAFLLPALQVHRCIWFLSGYNDNVIFHIQ